MKIDRQTLIDFAGDAGFVVGKFRNVKNGPEFDLIRCAGSNTVTELERLANLVAQHATSHALKDLEIMVTDQGVNVIKDGVLVAFQAHSAPRAQDVAAQLLIAGDHAWASSLACHCEACDRTTNGGLRSLMSVCPQCGDKRCPRAQYHENACQKAIN